MCGINGIFRKDKDLCVRIKNMNNSLIHRGPDSEGVFINEKVGIAFGHRRLSVIDLVDRSLQPMKSNSGRWIITYNGEIYNYLDLKAKTSYAYKTASDTEVILAYIEQYGLKEFLKNSNGMFAFALYDTIERTVYLCRDRLGIKPLYYYLDEKGMIFSSEIKGVLHSGLVEAILDEESIDDYLAYRYVREPYTFFKNIWQVPAGTVIQVNMNFCKEKKNYWEFPTEFNFDKEYNEKEIIEHFYEQLRMSVTRRMISDVPLGTYLSGGIDSSLLTAIVADSTEKSLHTFTIGFKELNEFRYSDMVSERYHTEHHKIVVNGEEYLKSMQYVMEYKDAPLGVPNEVMLAIMSKELKKNVTVVISGEGADELLGGYGRIFRSPFEYRNHIKDMDFYHYFIDKYEYVPRNIRNSVLNVSIGRRETFDSRIQREFYGRSNEQNVFSFFHRYHIKGLLQRLDTTTMIASVEARVPFLDHNLIEYTYKHVPYDLKLRWNSDADQIKARNLWADEFSEVCDSPKYLLKKVAKDFLPLDIIERKKMGFPVPLSRWGEKLQKRLRERLDEAFWMNRDAINILENQCGNYGNRNQMLWMFLSLQMFLDTYFTRKWTYN